MEGTFSGNLFVSDTLRDIDRLSKAGQAEPTEYETLIALENAPKRFGQITVTFKDEDHVLGRVNLEYGDSLDESGYPELPAKEGCAARWSTTKLTDLHLDTVVEAVYTDYITALASIYEREAGRSSLPRDRSATATACPSRCGICPENCAMSLKAGSSPSRTTGRRAIPCAICPLKSAKSTRFMQSRTAAGSS